LQAKYGGGLDGKDKALPWPRVLGEGAAGRSGGQTAAAPLLPQAGKLQISKAYRDRETGELRHGITVTLDQEDIFLHPEARLILRALVEWV